MGELMFVRLSEGRRVRDPLSSAVMLPENTYRVPRNQFWLRRLAAGDVVLAPQNGVQNKSEENKALSRKKKEKSGE